MQHFLLEDYIRKGNETHIYHGLKGRTEDIINLMGGALSFAMCVLGIVGIILSTVPTSTPDGYGFVKDVRCEVINYKNWCVYNIGIIDTPDSCTLKNAERFYNINDTMPIDIDKTDCRIWHCGKSCDRVIVGHKLLYTAAALLGVITLYWLAHYLRAKLTRPDEILPDHKPKEQSDTPSAPSAPPNDAAPDETVPDNDTEGIRLV